MIMPRFEKGKGAKKSTFWDYPTFNRIKNPEKFSTKFVKEGHIVISEKKWFQNDFKTLGSALFYSGLI